MSYYLIWYSILYPHGPLQGVDHLSVMRSQDIHMTIYNQYAVYKRNKRKYICNKHEVTVGNVIWDISISQGHGVMEWWSHGVIWLSTLMHRRHGSAHLAMPDQVMHTDLTMSFSYTILVSQCAVSILEFALCWPWQNRRLTIGTTVVGWPISFITNHLQSSYSTAT
jgi:hypothetical protein